MNPFYDFVKKNPWIVVAAEIVVLGLQAKAVGKIQDLFKAAVQTMNPVP